jgi:hypothetical protein
VLVTPLTFVSSAFVPVSTMPGWLQPFAEHQPLTPMINAVRGLAAGPQAAALLEHTSTYYVRGPSSGAPRSWCSGSSQPCASRGAEATGPGMPVAGATVSGMLSDVS